jgi:hypothetical protein
MLPSPCLVWIAFACARVHVNCTAVEAFASIKCAMITQITAPVTFASARACTIQSCSGCIISTVICSVGALVTQSSCVRSCAANASACLFVEGTSICTIAGSKGACVTCCPGPRSFAFAKARVKYFFRPVGTHRCCQVAHSIPWAGASDLIHIWTKSSVQGTFVAKVSSEWAWADTGAPSLVKASAIFTHASVHHALSA